MSDLIAACNAAEFGSRGVYLAASAAMAASIFLPNCSATSGDELSTCAVETSLSGSVTQLFGSASTVPGNAFCKNGAWSTLMNFVPSV